MHCSLFVFYLVQYAAQSGNYGKNRPREKITKEDRIAKEKGEMSISVFFFQSVHSWAYDWQDVLIERLDFICKRFAGADQSAVWYSDKKFLTLASPLCQCTNTMALVIFSLLDNLETHFLLFVGGGNLYMAGIVYWKILHFRKLTSLDR